MIKKEYATSCESAGKEVKGLDSAVLQEAVEMLSSVGIAVEFRGPTAQELMCLMQINPGDGLSAQVDDQEDKSFARLLNRGSHLE